MRKLRDMLEDEGGFPVCDISFFADCFTGGVITQWASVVPQCGSCINDMIALLPNLMTCVLECGGIIEVIATYADIVADIADTLGFCAGK